MNDYKTMTEIGAMLGGLTCHQVGRALTELGLRKDGWPTEDALVDGLATEQVTDGRYRLYIWDVDRVVPLLRAHLASKEPAE